MLQPGRFSLPEKFTGPHSQAACPECRARVRPYDTIDAEFDDGMDDDKNKPVTPGQRVFAAFFAVFMLSIGVYCLMGAPGSAACSGALPAVPRSGVVFAK